MIWWCPDCNNTYNDRSINYEAECPNSKCDGICIHLDELMYPAIRLLNMK